MTQQIIEANQYTMDNLDFTLLSKDSIQTSSPTEEIGGLVRYDYNMSESFYEIDVADLNMAWYPDQSFKDLLNDIKAIGQFSIPSPNMEEQIELITGGTEVIHSTESNDMANLIQSTDEQLAMIKSSDPTLPVVRPPTEKSLIKSLCDQSILLSQSVAVTVPAPNQLQLVHPLEDTYRARYKSDYFPQKGAVRRPRYVADNVGNHFITLQMPTEYNRDFTHEYIRVALITTSINDRGHFYSPYKFQIDHNDIKVPDQNPIYIPVQVNQRNDFTMKLHLVLIKSKLDQLNDAQPLKLFSDSIGTIQNIINEEKLSPKDLINTYQLDKSRIAFTLCTKLSNGLYEIHPETTIISSVITEAPTKPPATSKKTPKPVSINKKISCPNCSYCFDLTDSDLTKVVKKRTSNRSISRTTMKATTNNRLNKKKKVA